MVFEGGIDSMKKEKRETHTTWSKSDQVLHLY